MSWNDTEYFRMRAGAERSLAAAATNPAAAAVHTQLAEGYERLVREAKRPTLRLVTEHAA